MNLIKFTYNPETHVTTCKRRIKNKWYVGEAKCHPSDFDFESKLLGEHYAYTRSMIQELCAKRDAKRAELKALNHLYSICEDNPEIDLESNECYMIRRQIKMTERDATNLKDLICRTRKEMRDMIAAKDVYHNKLRAIRKKEGLTANVHVEQAD